jgi:hypothetical protein
LINNSDKFSLYREQYKTFIFDKYEISDDNNSINIKYYFSIPNLANFEPEIKILKKHIKFIDIKGKYIDNLVFHIGLIELISYWKCTCSPNVIIKCGYLNSEQINWFKKLYFYGLGELFYTNNIETSLQDFMSIQCEYEENIEILEDIIDIKYDGIIIPVGGGKDSVITLELLKNTDKNYCLIVNPKEVSMQCSYLAGYTNDRIIEVNRTIDKKLIELNNNGYINGHTPFSSFLAFLSYFIAFITNKKYIALSNESSANESNVIGEKINHQYSKSYEFENDFRYYANKYLKAPIQYFSFLRPLNELQIAMLFSTYEKYHSIFKSCNVGSKKMPWEWCCNCPKCLFVYIILSPFLYKDKLVNIFKQDMFENKKLLDTFKELSGFGETKPFECVGTFEEIRYAITNTITNLENNNEALPYLLNYYKEHYPLANMDNDLTKLYNKENNLPLEFDAILKKEVMYD